jgi:hypothetical protein
MQVGFTLQVIKRRARQPQPAFRESLLRVLKHALTRETAFFAVPEGASGVGVILVHRGRSFGLELKERRSSLSVEERAAQVRLRDAGMRVEVARDLDEALMHLAQMGIPLRRDEVSRRRKAA